MKSVTTLFPLLLVTACSVKGDYPSLSPRPIEQASKQMLAEAPVAPQMIAPSDPKIVTRIAAFRDQAVAGHKAFESALADAQSEISKHPGAKNGTDGWIANQVSLSRVEVARGPIKDALAGLDEVRNTLIAGGPSADQPVLEMTLAQVQGSAKVERDSYDALEAEVSLP